MNTSELYPGHKLLHDELVSTFKCGNMGGMRKVTATNLLILISDPFKGLYEDKWIDNILYYTGMGKIGDQKLEGNQNKTLFESNENEVAIYLFEVFNPGVYTYLGQVELASDPYQDMQIDDLGKNRKVWMFPLKIKDEVLIKPITYADLKEKNALKEKRAKNLTDTELKNRLKNNNSAPSSRSVISNGFDRDPYVIEYVKRKANGACALCEKPAPFHTKMNVPFLEVHHIHWLSKGGLDSIENAVALCPNCHRRMHLLDKKQEVEKLKKVALEQS